MAVKFNTENFETEVLNHEGIVMVDFFATWCGPCKMLSPVIDEIAEEGQIKVGKVDIDESMEIAKKYRVMSVPTVVIFKDGQPVKTHVGFAEKDELDEMWKALN